MKELISIAKSLNIECCGFCVFEGKTYFVCLFPYYTGVLPPFPMSRYARLMDYHIIARSYLQKIALQSGAECDIFVDAPELPERFLASAAGLGFIGKNKCLINEIYGSYVFIGGLILKEKIDFTPGNQIENQCGACEKCVSACPGEVLPDGNFAGCVSRLTQSGNIDGDIKLPSMWGCDICQDVCPKNENIKLTPIVEFYRDIISDIDIDNLSNSQFKAKYGRYPFAYKGRKIIERNMNLLG